MHRAQWSSFEIGLGGGATRDSARAERAFVARSCELRIARAWRPRPRRAHVQAWRLRIVEIKIHQEKIKDSVPSKNRALFFTEASSLCKHEAKYNTRLHEISTISFDLRCIRCLLKGVDALYFPRIYAQVMRGYR